jgi:hypothetical protein
MFQIKFVNHAILEELEDLKHVQLHGKTKKQAEEDRRRDAEYRAHKAHCKAVDRYNASSDDEKFSSDLFDYKFESFLFGLFMQVVAQICIFNINSISSSNKNIIILEISGVLLHVMLQYFSYISFINNWQPKRKTY